MSKEYGNQKIKCSVKECLHNCNDETCELEEIKVCCCSNHEAKNHKDTACKSYDKM